MSYEGREYRLDIMMRFFRVSFRAMFRYPVLATAIPLLVLAAQTSWLFAPLYLQRLVDAFTAGPGSVPSTGPFVLHYVVPIVALRLGCWLSWRASGFLASELQSKVVRDLTNMCFMSVLEKSYRFFADRFTGSLVRRIQSLGSSFRDLTESLWWSVLPMAVSFVGSIILLGRHNALFAWILFGWIVFIFVSQLLVSRFKLPYDAKRAIKYSHIVGAVSDAVTNATNISLFSARREEVAYVAKQTNEWYRMNRFSWRIAETGSLVQNILNAACELLLMAYVIDLWRKGHMTVGEVVYVQSMLLIVFQNAFDIGRVIRRLYEAAADVHEMLDILDEQPEIRDKRGAKPLEVKRAEIRFDGVTFAYKDQKILKDFSLRIAPRQKVALVGPSGSGKTTVTKLLFRFFDIQKGTISIDGQDIAKITQDSLRDAIAYVPQEPILFHRSLRDNIRYGRRDATDEEVEEAARQAHCHDFIESFAEKYDTMVGERGIKLSGGERQRIAIARAILKNAPILVLDEATSSLDSESESLIQDALRTLMKNKTVIVIAHRLSTIMDMDRIIVMRDGQILDDGTHQSLRGKVGIYQKLWNIQAGGFQPQ